MGSVRLVQEYSGKNASVVVAGRWPATTKPELRREVEVDVLAGCDGDAVDLRRRESPLMQGSDANLLDAVADGLQDLGLYNIALLVDRNFDDDVPAQPVWKLVAKDWRIGRDDGKGDSNIVIAGKPVCK